MQGNSGSRHHVHHLSSFRSQSGTSTSLFRWLVVTKFEQTGYHLTDCGNFAGDNTPVPMSFHLQVCMQRMHRQWGHATAEPIMRFASSTSTRSAERPVVMLMDWKQAKCCAEPWAEEAAVRGKPAGVPWPSGETLC